MIPLHHILTLNTNTATHTSFGSPIQTATNMLYVSVYVCIPCGRAGIAFDELGLTLASAGEVRGVPLRGAWTLGASEKERSLTPVDDSNIFT